MGFLLKISLLLISEQQCFGSHWGLLSNLSSIVFPGENLPLLRAAGALLLIWLGIRSHQAWQGREDLDFSFYRLWGCKAGRTGLHQDPSQDCWAQWKLLCLSSGFLCWGLTGCLEMAKQQGLASPGVSGLSCVPPESCPHPRVLLPTAVDGNSCHAFSEEKDWVLLHRGGFNPFWFWCKN